MLDVWGSWGVWRHRWGQWSALRLLPAAPHLPSRPAIPAKRFSLALFKPTHIETEEKIRMLWLPIPSILRCKRLEHHLWFTLGHPESPQGGVEVAILALPKLPYHFCESIRRGIRKGSMIASTLCSTLLGSAFHARQTLTWPRIWPCTLYPGSVVPLAMFSK